MAGALAIATPAAAQDDGDISEGLGLLGEGSRLLLEGLIGEARPHFEENVLPFLNRMGELMDDVTSYELPERLPNGDILIRRAPDAPEFDPEVGENGDVEL